jgi:NAD+ kinase
MMRVLILGSETDEFSQLVRESGLEIVSDTPDVVLTYGGDGLLLHSEREWPGIPKLPLRNSRHGRKCEPHEAQEALSHLLRGDLVRSVHHKIRLEAGGRTQLGLNDATIRNARPTSAVRCLVWIGEREYGHEIIGDGIVVATPFGSTGYYRSITRGIFRVGLGLAFNNTTEQMDHTVLPEDVVIRVRITRGPAVAATDNHPELIALDRGDEILIRQDDETAVILGLKGTGTHDWGRRARSVDDD